MAIQKGKFIAQNKDYVPSSLSKDFICQIGVFNLEQGTKSAETLLGFPAVRDVLVGDNMQILINSHKGQPDKQCPCFIKVTQLIIYFVLSLVR